MKAEQLALMGLLGIAALKVIGSNTVHNEGTLSTEAEATLGSTEGSTFAPVQGIDGRDPNVACGVPPPQMISTSLLPADTEGLGEADFVGITPEKLTEVNLLSSGWALGRDTQQNTLRNPTHDLRSEPANPQTLNLQNNSFLNTTITHQEFFREFEPERVAPQADTEVA